MNAPPSAAKTAPLEWTTLAALDPEARVDLWHRAYEGYAVPTHFDRATLDLMGRIGDLDDAHSPVLRVGGETVGFGALGLRGERAWLGGFGVALPWRRRGLGRRLLEAWFDAARSRGARRAQLEVLEPNAAARALYEAQGFRSVRWLEVWSLAAVPAADAAVVERVDVPEAHGAIDALSGPVEPWQRDAAVVRAFAPESLGLRVGPASAPLGAAVVRPAPGRVSVLRLRTAAGAPREGVIAALLAAAMTHTGATSLRWLNVAEDDPGSAALRELGGQLEIRQVEMARAL